MEIFFQAIESAPTEEARINAADNLLLVIQKIIKDAGPVLEAFVPVLSEGFEKIRALSR